MSDLTPPDSTLLEPSSEPIGACTVLRGVADLPGVDTLEGRVVPLLSGENVTSHMIVMEPGMWCYPHPHPTESLIFTPSGRWVFCTTDDEGQEIRTVLGPGDLFHMDYDVPTGFENPFDEPAVLLIFKSGSWTHAEMVEGLVEMQASLERQVREEGAVFTLAELPEDHPARTFAASLDA
ncbi:cupin domain-containing protein [Euzebya tangerina]|uniref:cupin domain-containing protein n=1 Tax=Euzebya tangerina TaxID=591198 RepID=UPI000E31C81F|nr:cupin domain-containing protein [Euzebya tangerina]